MLQLQNAGFFILLLGVLVTVHELGHFLVAKACGVKVLKFSIGFGPKLIGFTKGETEYQIALLPLGGFVKMAGDLPHEELSPEEASRGFLAQPPWKRGLIVLAGPAFNLIFPVLIYFFVYLGPHQATSTLVGSVTPDMPAVAAGIRAGDRVRSVDGVAVTTFGDMQDALVGRFDRSIPVVVERDGQQVSVQVTPRKKVDSNPIETVERGEIGVGPMARPATVGVPHGSVAEQAGLRTFDLVLTVNGAPVADEEQLRQAVARLPVGTPLELGVRRLETVEAGAVTGRVPRMLKLSVARQAGEGQAALGAEPADMYLAVVLQGSAADKAGLRAGDRIVSIDGDAVASFQNFQSKLSQKKAQPFTLVWQDAGGERREAKVAQAAAPSADGMGSRLMLGVSGWVSHYTDVPPMDEVTVHMSPGAAFKEAALIVPKIVGQMVRVIGGLFVGAVPLNTVGGPIMMYQMASKSAEQGLDSFLNLMAIISINLGVMNLLPIPVLDGFHLLSAAWEGVRRRPIPVRVREVANMVGLALLIMLMLLAVTNDVMR